MNTRDTGPKAKNKAQTGDSRLLNGYKVGMRDPNGYGARLAAKVWHVAPDGRWGCRAVSRLRGLASQHTAR